MEEKKQKRILAGLLAVIMIITGVGVPLPFPSEASDIWPQKSTAPFFCLDGGKGWKKVDRYDMYKFDTMPSPLTETQAKRLFWAYPDNWSALKNAAKQFDPELYAEIASTTSSANIVKYVKDDAGTKFAWVADNREIEDRAIAVMEQASSAGMASGKEAPDAIREATSEDTAVPFQVLPFSDGPGALDTEFVLGKEFIRDIAKIEPQSVWDNGSTGGNVGWLDASQDKNIAKSVMGENLYEVTWGGDAIKIHNNGSAIANENAVGSMMSEEERYNKTMVRYKITMRSDSGWYTEGSWNPEYLHEWMDFKACINAPNHQRLYKADMRIIPSDMVFYLVISQDGEESWDHPEYGVEPPELEFNIYRHKEIFSADYNVRLVKQDDETGMPLKGSQFYLYERFEDGDKISKADGERKLAEKNLNFRPWSGFQVFSEGTTNEKGEITYKDARKYTYEKTYCDGHAIPSWASMPDDRGDAGNEDGKKTDAYEEAAEQTRDNNRAAAKQWLELVEACETEAEGGCHFHWLADESAYDEVQEVLECGEAERRDRKSNGNERKIRAASEEAFGKSGCRADCEDTYQKFIRLRFTYTWKEIQARNGYILHDMHRDDIPVEMIMTDSSQAGANAEKISGSSRDIPENIWYSGNGKTGESTVSERKIPRVKSSLGTIVRGTSSDAEADVKDAAVKTTASNAEKKSLFQRFYDWFAERSLDEDDDNDEEADGWGEYKGTGDFEEILADAKVDGIRHLDRGDPEKYSHCNGAENCKDAWHVYDHRTEGRIHITKKDRDLFRRENEKYSSYGDTEGDGTLQGAIYGLFAAEDIVHPDAEMAENGILTHTGIVYKKHDLVAAATTDQDGNADFLCYTEAPGMEYDYTAGKIRKRTDIIWNGPENLYQENEEKNGNFWIGRPLILGKYYIKELSRSEGYELSVNGMDQEMTNLGTGFDTPISVTDTSGTAVVAMPELAAAMEGDDGSGKGYDELPFTVTSSGTSSENGEGGYEILAYGFPEGTKFYRVDTGEELVTGPHVTGKEQVVVKDEAGRTVWKQAESDFSDILYEPERDASGNITGQEPVSRMEPQILKAEQIPEKTPMILSDLSVDEEDGRFRVKLGDCDLSDETSENFLFLKAQTEEVLGRNGYEVPITAEGVRSLKDAPVYSRGVKKGQKDIWGMTTEPGEPAKKTVYGAAIQEITVSAQENDCILDLMRGIFTWYQEHPQWNFGGIEGIRKEGEDYRVTLYAGASSVRNRRFFTSKVEKGKKTTDRVYAVYEDPVNLRWVYQEYKNSGKFQFRADRQYVIGTAGNTRYYLDATLTPVLMPGTDGRLTEILHQVMIYHKKGEEVIDYLSGDPAHGYRVPQTRLEDKIEITTEKEIVEKDVELQNVVREKAGAYRIQVQTFGKDAFGKDLTDRKTSLTLNFIAKLPEKDHVLTEKEILAVWNANIWGYKGGDRIGYAEYLVKLSGAAFAVSVSKDQDHSGTYITAKRLIYRGQDKISEDGDTGSAPVLVLERPVKQKVHIEKKTDDGENIGNFRFKIYLKSNLERIFCTKDGEIFWMDKNGAPVQIEEYREKFPELVQKIYTKQEERQVLETVERKTAPDCGEAGSINGYNYEKFFAAIRTADTDLWKRTGRLWNTSFKPFVSSFITGKKNEINTSEYAKENAKRSDAVRQFAIDWYLKEEQESLKQGTSTYSDEPYDHALYLAIRKAENYLQPFFKYDLGKIYAIAWDSEEKGGSDGDKTTLAVRKEEEQAQEEAASAISRYLPYGEYVIVEEQPYASELLDFKNKHYEIDAPKEIFLPEADGQNESGDTWKENYIYRSVDSPWDLAKKYLIRFNEEWAKNQKQEIKEYVILAHSNDGDFEVYPYGLSEKKREGRYEPYGNEMVKQYYHYRSDSENGENENGKETMTGVKTAYDREYAPMLVPWSIVDPKEQENNTDWTGYGEKKFLDRKYLSNLRIEKLDAETGEPILHDDAVFGVYRAERNEAEDGDGEVKYYTADTMILGSRYFLEAMRAKEIRPFARRNAGVGELFYGTVPEGTPICQEKDLVGFTDKDGLQTGTLMALSTIRDIAEKGILQAVGYAKTSNPLSAGVYVVAEVKPPSGYVRSEPVAVEIYSDGIRYSGGWTKEKTAAAVYGYEQYPDGIHPENVTDTARIYVENTATILKVSKTKTIDSTRGMKVSGRVEGTITELRARYGLENLDLAYDHAGIYQGFGWKKGTLEMLEQRKHDGERVEIVYENGIFQGYGYVTRRLETSDHQNPYVSGAKLALYDAIRVKRTGDSQDHAFEGVEITRDRNGNVTDIVVKEGHAGEKLEFSRRKVSEEESPGEKIWEIRTVKRKDTPVLFYDLGNLDIVKKGKDGTLYGYDRAGRQQKITFDTESIYALKNGQPAFEISGGDFTKLVYDRKSKVFTAIDPESTLYHLDESLCREAEVDVYTGLAYVKRMETGANGREQQIFYVWPVVKETDTEGNLIGRRKILTGRPAEIMEGSESAYITGTWNPEAETFEKRLEPALDEFGLVKYYPESGALYKKGEPVYDRDGDYVTYRYEDLLEMENRAAYHLNEREHLLQVGQPEDETDDMPLKHRKGESYLIPNVWISGEKTIQDGRMDENTDGQVDLLRRVIPGSYILEELEAPAGYVRTFPSAVEVQETKEIQRVILSDEKTKVEISKIDGTEKHSPNIENRTDREANERGTEIRGAYSQNFVKGAKLALFKAKRVNTADYEKYHRGYYLVKAEETPAVWNSEDPVDNHKVSVTAMWITDGKPKYFEGIPEGDYILEELEAPTGYLPAAMEITVEETGELQSFILKDDHTKLEILKYERNESGEKEPLFWPASAEFILCEAVLDENGEVKTENGDYLYRKDRIVDRWKADDLSEYIPVIPESYEKMFGEYGNEFRQFSWKKEGQRRTISGNARLLENTATENKEIITQLWELSDGSRMRVFVTANGDPEKLKPDGHPSPAFEYQFHYHTGSLEQYPEMVSYDTRAGLHRIDRIPEGKYVLLETRIPDGYQGMDPMLVTVSQMGSIIRYEVENRRNTEEKTAFGRVRIRKTDADDKSLKLSDAWFEAVCVQTGERTVFVTGEDGIALSPELPIGYLKNGAWSMYEYEVQEILAPPGYGHSGETVSVAFDREKENLIQLYEVSIENKKTKVQLSKLDIATGEELPGASLELKTIDGTIIDSWISGKTPYFVEGTLVAGETYILTEISAPDGYETAEAIRFTVPKDGSFIKIEMTDRRKTPERPVDPTETETSTKPEEPETTLPAETPTGPEESETPVRPAEPEYPTAPVPHDRPKKPVEAEWTESESEPESKPDREKTYGTITVHYERRGFGSAKGRVHQKDRTSRITPKTGDTGRMELAVLGLFIGSLGLWYLHMKKEENERKKEHEDKK